MKKVIMRFVCVLLLTSALSSAVFAGRAILGRRAESAPPCGPYILKATYVGDDFYEDDTAEIRIDVETGTGEIWVDGKLAARLKITEE